MLIVFCWTAQMASTSTCSSRRWFRRSDRPLETGEVLLLVCRGAFVLALAGLIGASLAVIAMSVSVAVIILALCFGLGQMLATMVPALFSGGRFALIAPDWANTILLGAWLE